MRTSSKLLTMKRPINCSEGRIAARGCIQSRRCMGKWLQSIAGDEMTVRGRVERGVVVLAKPGVLPEGAEVEVSTVQSTQVGEGLAKLAGKAKDLPEDLAEHHDNYRRQRQS